MNLRRTYAHVSCSDLGRSGEWYATLFGRPADQAPMDGLREWLHGDSAGLQLFENPDDAGHNCLTLVVEGLENERQRMFDDGLEPGDVEPATSVSIVRLRDPDGNLVVLAEPHQA